MLSTDRRKQYAWGLIGLLSAFLIVVSVYAIQATNRAVAVVESCTTPHGGCYKRQERETTRTVKLIKLTSIAANHCTLLEAGNPPPPSFRSIQRCVDERLAAWEKDRP